jgi:hypothetical protein
VPVQAEGVYTLTAIQTDPSGAQASQSGGFVVPYSPEYGLAGTDRSFLEGLATRTGGKLISDPSDAFVHSLPSVGAPRPLWPLLMIALAILLVADVGVRRVRVSAIELKAGYSAIRRRLGYVDDLAGFGRWPSAASQSQRSDGAAPVTGLISATSGEAVTIRPRAPTVVTQSSRLLAAKQRASRR